MTVLILLTVGLLGLVVPWVPGRCGRRSPRGWALLVGVTALVLLVTLAVGLGPLSVSGAGPVIAAIAGLAWVGAGEAVPGERGTLVRGGSVAGVLAVSLLAEPIPAGIAWGPVAAVAGVGMLLAGPANDVIAALLTLVRRRDGVRGLLGPDGSLLSGGRWIGALERGLILVLAFSDAPAAVAAIVAAKGVIRFPEISRDAADGDGSGAKAEEFLIGSFGSWLIAALAYLLLRALGVG